MSGRSGWAFQCHIGGWVVADGKSEVTAEHVRNSGSDTGLCPCRANAIGTFLFRLGFFNTTPQYKERHMQTKNLVPTFSSAGHGLGLGKRRHVGHTYPLL